MPFDDHGDVVFLSEVVRQLMRLEIGRSREPDKRLQEWTTWLADRNTIL